MRKKRIAVLLPFKDHFTKSNAGSASIWVKDFNQKHQKFDFDKDKNFYTLKFIINAKFGFVRGISH